MVASDVAAAAAFAVPTNLVALPSASTVPVAAAAAAATCTAKAITLLLPGGFLLGALSEAAAAAVAVRSLYLWSGLSSVNAAASAAAISSAASASSASAAGGGARLGADAIASIATFALWTGCVAAGARLGSVLQPVGITGGIACGKSTVAELLSASEGEQPRENDDKGDIGIGVGGKPPFAIIDVDGIGHDILIPGKLGRGESAYEDVVSEFGTAILSKSPPTSDERKADGGDDRPRIERRSLGDVIFRDPSKRRTLNKLTHPLISKIMVKRVITWNIFARANRTENRLVAVDIPLLYEVGLKMRILFGLVVVVACKPSTQLARLMERNKDLTQEQCQNRIDSQMPVTDKVEAADVVIWNDSNMDDLKAEVERARKEVAGRVKGWG
eukprot:CAMPEP_0178668494 /NCGR_PEP_ID=MMETSP0698-20121128/31611_1 /TAXON_ID=265572 /ORGANISM="Extubocellulus spinifer, Strain CCMP396" /LENGTH=386 /DNA_ID=CAMNT_0020312067 /DNA_START=67 /DNA_END=1224 /DNA_ORIENTATION=+